MGLKCTKAGVQISSELIYVLQFFQETRQLLSYSRCLQLTGPVYNGMLRKVTFHNDHSVKTKTTRHYLDVYIQSNLKQSQNQAEKLKKLADIKRKVNFWSSQVEAFINREVSSQFLIILNTKTFILNGKEWPIVHFIP